MSQDKEQELELFIRAKYPILSIVSAEERRVEEMLRRVAARRHKRLLGWTVTEGLQDISTVKAVMVDATVRDPLQVLEAVADSRESAIFVLKDFHPFMDTS